MEEVVITGYQTVDRRKSTSSVTTRKMEDLHIPGISSLDQMLQGQIPDLIMMSNSGEVGVVPKLRIRGTSTLIGNREPLWVLDGIIMQDPVDVLAADLNDPDYINRVGNAIAGINPQDIERIEGCGRYGFVRNSCRQRCDCGDHQERTRRTSHCEL